MVDEMDKDTFNNIVYDILQKTNDIIQGDVTSIPDSTFRNLTSTKSYDSDSDKSSEYWTSVKNEIADNIGKDTFTNIDIINASKIILKEKIQPDYTTTLNETLKDEDKTLMEKIKDIFNPIFYTVVETLFDFGDKLIIFIISICIVANLQYRSQLHSGLFFPNDETKFPYVYYDKKSNANQTNLVSIIASPDYKVGKPVFQNVTTSVNPAINNKDDNFCMINDPYSVTSVCNNNDSNIPIDYFKDKILLENMNFFAKKFIELNKSKLTSELTLYGMLFYVLTYSCSYSNGVLYSINEVCKPIFESTFKKTPSLFNKLCSLLFVFIFYIIFKTTSESWSTLMNKLLMAYKNDDFYVDTINKDEDDNVTTFPMTFRALKIISGIFSPFMLFFKLFFVLLYPISCFFCLLAFLNFASYTNSILIKCICYYGLAVQFVSGVWTIYATFKNALDETNTNITFSLNDLCDSFITTITTLITTSTTKLTKNIKDMDDVVNLLDEDTESSLLQESFTPRICKTCGKTLSFTTINKESIWSKLKSSIMKLFVTREGITSSGNTWEDECGYCNNIGRGSNEQEDLKYVPYAQPAYAAGEDETYRVQNQDQKKCTERCKETYELEYQKEKADEKLSELAEEAEERKQDWIDRQKAGRQGDTIASKLFSNATEENETACSKVSSIWTTITILIYNLLILMISPINILLSFLPVITSVYMSFNITKTLTLDYMSYIKHLFCNISNSAIVVRVLFHILIITEIYTLTKTSPINYISLMVFVFLSLLDLCKFGHLWKNMCPIRDNNVDQI